MLLGRPKFSTKTTVIIRYDSVTIIQLDIQYLNHIKKKRRKILKKQLVINFNSVVIVSRCNDFNQYSI